MDSEFTPGILETPSLMTPNIGVTPLLYKPLQPDALASDTHQQLDSSSNPSSITTVTTNDESSSVSSADIKLSKIENDLKQSLIQPRKPTESPFQKMLVASVLTLEKNLPPPPTTDDGVPIDIPSTAEVMNDIESFAKYPLARDSSERETITSDNNRFDSSPTHSMGMIVSPKKKLLIRSQSHTEPASPTALATNHFSQAQRPNRDEESSTDDDDNNHFQHAQDLPTLAPTIDSKSQADHNPVPTYTMQLQANPNGVHPAIVKQQPVVLNNNNKRSFPQTIITAALPKANAILLSQQPVINEVTSSDQLLGIKRQKISSGQARVSFPSPNYDDNNNNNTASNGSGSDDQRKKQIRDSNREAARRCRERRRNYIEQLESNLEQCKAEIKQLTDNLARAERENTQLRAIISETKLFHTGARLSPNGTMIDFSAMVANANGMDLNSETTDGNTIPRNFITRNTH